MFKKIFHRHIRELLKSSTSVPLNKNSKFVVFSDCHRGSGDRADDFFHNQLIYLKAMEYYSDNGFTYFELGDGDELWENANFDVVKERYRTIFEIFDVLYRKNRFFMLWGNHNRRWKNKRKVKEQLSSIIEEGTGEKKEILKDLVVHESLILRSESEGIKDILLIHGHQGELLNDVIWWFGRFFIKTFWKFFQMKLGIPDPTSPAMNYRTRRDVDRRFMEIADRNDVIVIVGHTHFPIFPEKGESGYFNDGSCVHPRCITGIEIENEKISLIKWHKEYSGDAVMRISKKVLEGPVNLRDL